MFKLIFILKLKGSIDFIGFHVKDEHIPCKNMLEAGVEVQLAAR